jgi:CheY-like chemotaxis protein
VNSTLGRGTIFQLWIPAARAATAPISAVAAPATGLMNLAGAKILLMDDEETIRRLGENLLRRMNCQPALATNGEECVRLYRAAMESGQPFDLVILDLTIPGGMGGRETIAELRKLDPCVCAIVSSGYSNDPVLANYRDYGFQAVVPKPYDITVLAGAIRRVLGSTL